MNTRSVRLKLCAIWHLEQVDKANNDRDRKRHEEIADRLFIAAHLAR